MCVEKVSQLVLEAFVRSDLPEAARVEECLADFRQRVPGVEVVVHDVLQDRAQLVRLNELTKKFGRTNALTISI